MSPSPTASILSFPMELPQEIAKHMSSLSALRLACKMFNEAVTPQMFSRLHIAFKDGKLDQFLEVLKSLALNAHPAILHARLLMIGHLSPSQRPGYTRNPEEREKRNLVHKLEVLEPYNAHLSSIKEWLPLGLSRLRKVSSIIWVVNYFHVHDWSREVISGISQITSLTDFQLSTITSAGLNQERCIQLSTLVPVQVLSVFSSRHRSQLSDDGSIQGLPELIEKSSHQLRRLRVASAGPFSADGKTPLLSYLFHKTRNLPLLTSLSLDGFDIILGMKDLVKLQSLKTLYLKSTTRSDDDDSRITGNLWPMLQAKNIRLEEIMLDRPDEWFFQYLRSYTGLKTLIITSATHSSQTESDSLGINFYESDALISHGKSLQKLVVHPTYEGKWCFGEHCIHTLSRLTNLRHLSMSIVTDSAQAKFLPYEPGIMRVPAWYEYEYDPSHSVCQLLQTATSLPKLELLSIDSACLSSNRGRDLNDGVHIIDSERQIYTNVTSYGPLDPSEYRFEVEISGSYLMPQMAEELGEYRYTLT